ncbi:MAG: hypothetical protein NC910_04395, partial [Candidatus Omnitrophica bacterium]|nr:hypothetical protein [Candidatus Omnitrophota bacterium]
MKGTLWFKTLVHLLVLMMAVIGVPLPIPPSAPRPLKALLEGIDAPKAAAFQIKRVLRGTTTMSTSQENLVVSLSGQLGGVNLDLNKTFIIATASCNDNDRRRQDVMAMIDDPTAIQFARQVSSVAITIDWMVVEFDSGVNVITGFSVFSETTTSKTITLPSSVVLDRSFPIISWKSLANSTTGDEFNQYAARLTGAEPTTQSLLIERGEATSTYNNDISYQVIEFDTDVDIQQGVTQIANGATQASVSLTSGGYNAVKGDKSMLFVQRRPTSSAAGRENRYSVYATMTGTGNTVNNLTFTRYGTTNATNVVWQLLEFKNEVFSQKGTGSFTGTASTISLGNTIDLNRSFAFISTAGNTSDQNGLDEIMVRGQLSGAQSLVLTRETAATSTVTTSYWVGEFPPLNITGPNGDLDGDGIFQEVDDVEIWAIDQPGAGTHMITWNWAHNIKDDNIRIELSTDGGSTFPYMIVDTTANIQADAGQYAWNIPATMGSGNDSIISSNCKIKISDPSISTSSRNFDVSNGPFVILGSVTVTAPNGSEIWNVGTTHDIEWNHTGNIGTVKIELSIDSGSSWLGTALFTGVSGTAGTKSWTIAPDYTGETMRIRVKHEGSGLTVDTVQDASNGDFEIRPTITITSPAVTDVWATGKAYNIDWTVDGQVGNVDIYYSRTTGVSWVDPAIVTDYDAGTAANRTYAWLIPAGTTPTTAGKIRIWETVDHDNMDTGPDLVGQDETFEIVPSITVTSPVTNDIRRVDTVYPITWVVDPAAALDQVKILYSINGGTWTEVPGGASVDADQGSLSWDTPPSVSNNVKVRVEETGVGSDPANVYGESGIFKIKGDIVVDAPIAGETWLVGSTKRISWTVAGVTQATYGNLNIDLSKTNGGAGNDYPISITTGLNPDTVSFFDWPVTDQTSETCKIKVSDPDDSDPSAGGVAGVSGSFKIQKLTLTYPATAPYPNNWKMGTTEQITWTRVGASMGNIDIKYSTDGGSTYLGTVQDGVASSLGQYDWLIPGNAISTEQNTQMKIKLRLSADPSQGVVSTDPFTMVSRLVILVPSDGTQVWSAGTSQNISWTTDGPVSTVKLYYSTDGGSTYPGVIESTAITNSSPYLWTIPAAAIDTDVKVKIQTGTDAYAGNIFDVSDNIFEVKPAFNTITSPAFGEIWNVGDTSKSITWTTTGAITNVKIEYKTSAAGSYTTIVSNFDNSSGGNTYPWSAGVADENSDDCYIRLTDVNKPATQLISSQFKIRPVITVTQPAAGADLTVGSQSAAIRWSRTGTKITNVDLAYSVNGGTFVTIESGVANASGTTYTWPAPYVPDQITQNAVVRVTDATPVTGNPNVYGNSGVFHIVGGIDLQSPVGGEYWGVSPKNRNITYQTTGSITSVKIYYSSNSGSTYSLVTTKSHAVPGTYSHVWTEMPDAVTQTARVKVTDANSEGYALVIQDASTDFHLVGVFDILQPENGHTVTAESTYSINWDPGTATGISNVILQYSTDGGSTWSYVNGTNPYTVPNSGSYYWNPTPAVISNQLKVRVYDPAYNPSTGITVNTGSGLAKLEGDLTLTSPTLGTESWDVGSTYNITWTKKGDFATAGHTVKIQYAPDGSSTTPTYTTIAGAEALAAADLSFPWYISEAIQTSNQAKIKIVDNQDSTVNDDSDAVFTVKGQVVLTAPNADNIELHVGEPYSITWTKYGNLSGLNIFYSTNSGSTFPNQLNGSAVNPADLSFPWPGGVPDQILGKVMKVKIVDTGNPNVNDVSEYSFEISGKLALGAPTGSEDWEVGTAGNIKWTPTGTWSQVELLYSLNGGSDWTSIDTVAAGVSGVEQTYNNWAPAPNHITSQFKIRVRDPNYPNTVVATSTTNNRILGRLQVNIPSGAGIIWNEGVTKQITWTGTGNVEPVNLYYSTDGGSNWTLIGQATVGGPAGQNIVNSGNGPQSYDWVVADVKTETAKIKVEDPDYPSVVWDASDNNFAIRPVVTVDLYPNPNADLPVSSSGHTIRITTTSPSTVTNVKL